MESDSWGGLEVKAREALASTHEECLQWGQYQGERAANMRSFGREKGGRLRVKVR